MINIIGAKEAFAKYVNNYDTDHNLIKLKYNHSLRVAENSRCVAVSLGLSNEEVALAELIGLLHDIGRFEQIKIYDIANDIKTEDHGDWGAITLFKDNLIRDFIKTNKYDDIIKQSIKAHNKPVIPNDYNQQEKLYSQIVRDADKMDIIYLLTNNELNIMVPNEALSDPVVESILNETYINKKDVVTDLDKMLLHLALIYDLNFSYSFNVIKENNYIPMIIDLLKLKEPKSITLCNKIKEFMNKDFKKKES